MIVFGHFFGRTSRLDLVQQRIEQFLRKIVDISLSKPRRKDICIKALDVRSFNKG